MNIFHQFIYGCFGVLFLVMCALAGGKLFVNPIGALIGLFFIACIAQKMYKNIKMKPLFKIILILFFVYLSSVVLYDFAVYALNPFGMAAIMAKHKIIFSIFNFLRYLKFGTL